MKDSIPVLRIAGPLLVFGGPYSNLEATRAVLDEAARLEIPADRIICTGDVVAYGADVAATVELVRNAGCHVIMGNCEESLAARSTHCGCGFPAASACERLSAAWYAHADRELDESARTWMANLPRRIDVEIGERRLAVIHGGVETINRFIFASSAHAIKATELDHAGVDGIIGGHCGLPFSQIIDEQLWHNAGAVGMPANDGTPRAWFSLITPVDDGISIEHRALGYDYSNAASKMRRAGLAEGYAAALETGLWPSCDVLPFREIRERGIPLQEGRVFWRRTLLPKQAVRRRPPVACEQLWPPFDRDNAPRLSAKKFNDPYITANGQPRASIALRRLKTLWFNTGTLCNIACRNCYIESSPKNDRLVYLTHGEVADYLDEIERHGWNTEEIGFTGGEPFMNPEFLGMLNDALSRGFRVLVLTNAMRPMQRAKVKLLSIKDRFGDRLTVRVSLDHYRPDRHEDERGLGTFDPTLKGIMWLAQNGFKATVAGRTMWGEDLVAQRAGYAALFAKHAIPIDAQDPTELILFPEMNSHVDVPEITTECWTTLGTSPADVMCSNSRMVVKRHGSKRPALVACTLLPYDKRFELGSTLKDAVKVVSLNHPHCAKFCVLGAGTCSTDTNKRISQYQRQAAE